MPPLHASESSGVQLNERQIRNRRMRNIAIALCVAGLVVLFYVITIIKVGPGVLRPDS
jgi:hypothetical protein